MVSVLSIERPQMSRLLATRTEKRTLMDMKSMKVTEARKQLYRLLAEVTLSSDPVQITGKRGNAVLLSEDDWLALARNGAPAVGPGNARIDPRADSQPG